jgi:hypothetical protein
MRTIYLLELEAPPNQSMCSCLTAAGGVSANTGTLWTVASDAVLDSLSDILTRFRTRFKVFHQLMPTVSDRVSDLNCYLSVVMLDAVDAPHSRRHGLFRDVTAGTIVGTSATVELLRAKAPDVRFEPVDNSAGMFRLVDAEHLPEPVVVPTVFASGRASDGVWAVQSDGRELLSDANRRAVRERGLFLAPYARVGNETLRWKRPPVVSGELWAWLETNGVDGLMTPPPYLGSV